MPIVTISRGAYCPSEEVAQKVAEKLGFECVSYEVLHEASEEFNVPELKLLRAFRDAPSVWDRFSFGKERYLAFIQVALLQHFQSDNVVYQGLAGHYFIRGISHVLKVRIIGSDEDRVKILMQRERIFEEAAEAMRGLPGHGLARPKPRRELSKDEALQILEGHDEARRKWGLHLYGIDTHDPSHYDLVIRMNKLSVEDVAEVIGFTARLDRFQATARSQRAVDDLLLTARVKASLIEHYPRVNVSADGGFVYIGLEGGSPQDEKAIQDTVRQISDVKKVDVRLYPFVTPD